MNRQTLFSCRLPSLALLAAIILRKEKPVNEHKIVLKLDEDLYDILYSISRACNRTTEQFIITMLRGYAEKYQYLADKYSYATRIEIVDEESLLKIIDAL